MAEVILPLQRTIFLPAGAPSVGSVRKVSGDLREVRCGCIGQEVYCSGEADILIDYHSGARSIGPFAKPGPASTPWQALVTVPFLLSAEGGLPPVGPFEVEFSCDEWFVASARAVELRGTVRIYCKGEGSPPAQPRKQGFGRTQKRQNMANRNNNSRRAGVMEERTDSKQMGTEQGSSIRDGQEAVADQSRRIEIVDLSGRELSDADQRSILQALTENERIINDCGNLWGNSAERESKNRNSFSSQQQRGNDYSAPAEDEIESNIERGFDSNTEMSDDLPQLEPDVASFEFDALDAAEEELAEQLLTLEELEEKIAELQSDMQGRLAARIAELQAEAENINNMQAAIDELQSDMQRALQERIAELQAEAAGISNIESILSQLNEYMQGQLSERISILHEGANRMGLGSRGIVNILTEEQRRRLLQDIADGTADLSGIRFPTQGKGGEAQAVMLSLDPEVMEAESVAEPQQQKAAEVEILPAVEEVATKVEKPRKRRAKGIPCLNVEADNTNIEFTAFRIEINL